MDPSAGLNSTWYDVIGPSGAPAVLMVHGSTVTRCSWLPQIDALSQTYRLIIPDLPGHGALHHTPFRMEAALETLCKAVEIEAAHSRVAVVGVSLGGHVATLFASRYPAKVSGLVLSGASMNFSGLTGLWMRFSAFLLTKVFKEERMRSQGEQNIRRKWPKETAEAIIAAGIFPNGAAQSFVELPRYDFRAALSGINAPVLILNGERDKPNRKGEAAFAAAAPNARLAVIPGAGHACNIEQPDLYNQQVLAFLGSL